MEINKSLIQFSRESGSISLSHWLIVVRVRADEFSYSLKIVLALVNELYHHFLPTNKKRILQLTKCVERMKWRFTVCRNVVGHSRCCTGS